MLSLLDRKGGKRDSKLSNSTLEKDLGAMVDNKLHMKCAVRCCNWKGQRQRTEKGFRGQNGGKAHHLGTG